MKRFQINEDLSENLTVTEGIKIQTEETLGNESWTLTKGNKIRMKAAKMRFLREIEETSGRDVIRITVLSGGVKSKMARKCIRGKITELVD